MANDKSTRSSRTLRPAPLEKPPRPFRLHLSIKFQETIFLGASMLSSFSPAHWAPPTFLSPRTSWETQTLPLLHLTSRVTLPPPLPTIPLLRKDTALTVSTTAQQVAARQLSLLVSTDPPHKQRTRLYSFRKPPPPQVQSSARHVAALQ